MSNLLKEAIVDAQALRETALKSAESAIVDKYSDEVRKTLEKLIEQEEAALEEPALDPTMDMGADPAAGPDMGMEMPMEMEPLEGEVPTETAEEVAPGTFFGATDGLSEMEGENLRRFPAEGENVEVTIDLGALQEAIQELQSDLDEEFEVTEEALADILSEEDEEVIEEDDVGKVEREKKQFTASGAGGQEPARDPDDPSIEEGETTDEGLSTDSLLDALVEKLTVDVGAELSGWAGRSSEETKHEMERDLARRRSTDVEEELKDLKKAQEELFFENKQVKEQNIHYKQTLKELKETLHDVNLSNARLLYTNRVLKNASLNERQKSKIVEAISRAGSPTEARTIYNTLESAVETIPKSGPQSLSEAITRRSSVIRASRHETQTTDPFSLRMKKLAGIKS